jgi:hypothetical protein
MQPATPLLCALYIHPLSSAEILKPTATMRLDAESFILLVLILKGGMFVTGTFQPHYS